MYPLARLGLLPWLLPIPVYVFAGSRLSRARWPCGRPKAWTFASLAGSALSALAYLSFPNDPAPNSDTVCDGSNPISHAIGPITDWCEIPATIGFLVLATAMWWLMTAPRSWQGLGTSTQGRAS